MTNALIGAETLVLVLLLVLVAGLLRSHAEILRRLGPPETGPAVPDRLAEPPMPVAAAAPNRSVAAPPALSGTTLNGDSVVISLTADGGPATLLAFLSSGCRSCRPLFSEIGHRPLPGGARPVIVTRGGERESPAKLRSLAPSGVPLVLSSEAWEEFGVPGSPYFVLIDGVVRGEGVATSWEALSSLLTDAEHDLAEAGIAAHDPVERRLAGAGVGPGDPSLRPAGPPEGDRP